jgi:YjbE family integral membrane protein
MEFPITVGEISALLQVIMVDLVLAGDNAIVVGMVAAGLPREKRARVIFLGIVAATVMRVGFAVVTTQLLQIIGLTLAGGLLLLWVCWKLWREVETQRKESKVAAAGHGNPPFGPALANVPKERLPKAPAKTLRQAILQIVLADLSMSLDNVLAVAGVALDHPWVLVFGLALSVALMGAAATLIANLLKRWHWLVYVGLLIVFYVACHMIFKGSLAVLKATAAAGLF